MTDDEIRALFGREEDAPRPEPTEPKENHPAVGDAFAGSGKPREPRNLVRVDFQRRLSWPMPSADQPPPPPTRAGDALEAAPEWTSKLSWGKRIWTHRDRPYWYSEEVAYRILKGETPLR